MHFPRKIQIFTLYSCQTLPLWFDIFLLLCIGLLFIYKVLFALDILYKISDDILLQDILEKHLKWSLFAKNKIFLKRINKILPELQHDWEAVSRSSSGKIT
jgi:hypothetical protein